MRVIEAKHRSVGGKGRGYYVVTVQRGGSVVTGVWARVKLRKDTRCAACSSGLPRGFVGYRCVGDGIERAWRLCTGCVQGPGGPGA